MKCSKCGSERVSVQMKTSTKVQHHSCLYWLMIGWWLHPLLWIFATLPMLLIAIFAPKRQKTKTTSVFVCNNCGNTWRV